MQKLDVDVYRRFETETVVAELHGTDYGIEGEIVHANQTYIILTPSAPKRQPLLIPWTSIYTIRLQKPKETKP